MGLLKYLLPMIFIGHAGLALAAELSAIPSIDDPQKAKRIAVLSPQAVEMLFAIGAGHKIVAATEYADYPEEVKKIPRIGGDYGIQMEKLLMLQPDLVVYWSDGNKAEDIETMKSLGLKLYDSNPKTLESIADELEQLGELTGHTNTAKQVAEHYRHELANLKQHSQGLSKVKVFYQQAAQPLMTASGNTWVQQIINLCGGENVFSDAQSTYLQVSLENLLLSQPQVILQSQDKKPTSKPDWQQWSQLSAVKKHHVYRLDADLIHRAGPRVIEGIKATCLAINRAR